jgi:hypothetical protein
LKVSESEFGTAVALIPLMFNGKEKRQMETVEYQYFLHDFCKFIWPVILQPELRKNRERKGMQHQ